MEIILLQDVKSLGKKGEIVTVNDSYARNQLIPKKMGVEATAKAKNDLKLQNKHADEVAQENYENALALKKELEDRIVEVRIKAGSGGRAFGSVSSKEISQELKKQTGLDVDKKKLQIADPIKTFGVHEVGVKLHPKVTGTLRVKVTEE